MQETFQQVKGLVDNEKRVIYNSIQNIMGTSCLTIFKIIHLGSSLWGKNKTRVHRLYQNSKKNWKVNSFKLYKNHLTRDHTEYPMAVDKLLAYVNDANKNQGICYLKADNNVLESWVFKIGKSSQRVSSWMVSPAVKALFSWSKWQTLSRLIDYSMSSMCSHHCLGIISCACIRINSTKASSTIIND